MASIEEYNARKREDDKSFEQKISRIFEMLEEMKADTEANAEAIEELAAILGGE